jgi:hypothetical protein
MKYFKKYFDRYDEDDNSLFEITDAGCAPLGTKSLLDEDASKVRDILNSTIDEQADMMNAIKIAKLLVNHVDELDSL